MKVNITEEERRDQGTIFGLLSACAHGDAEQIESLSDHMRSAVHYAAPSEQIDFFSLRGHDLNPFLSFEYARPKTPGRRFPMVWPMYDPSSTLHVAITGCESIFEGRCSLVHASHDEKPFIFFSPDSPSTYTSQIGKSMGIKIAAFATNILYGLSPEEPLESWFPQERYQQLSVKGYLPSSAFLYEGIFSNPKKMREKGDYSILQVQNPLDDQSQLELLAWKYDPSGQDGPQTEFPEKIGAEFYFLGRLLIGYKTFG